MNRTLEQIISIPFYLLFLPAIPTFVHWSMVNENYNVKRLKKATYKDIKAKMLETEWTFNHSHPCSLFSKKYDAAYFHASIFRFGDVGYLLTPYGLLRANLLQRKIRKTLPDYTKYKKPYV